MYAYNVTINGERRRIYASNIRVAIGTALRGAAKIAGETFRFDKMEVLEIRALRESSRRYSEVQFVGVRKLEDPSDVYAYDWRAILRHDEEKWVAVSQRRSMICAAGDRSALQAGLGLGLIAASAEATHIAAHNAGGRVLMLEPITPELRAEAATLGGSK